MTLTLALPQYVWQDARLVQPHPAYRQVVLVLRRGDRATIGDGEPSVTAVVGAWMPVSDYTDGYYEALIDGYRMTKLGKDDVLAWSYLAPLNHKFVTVGEL